MIIRTAKDLGSLIRERRSSAGLTQAELAKRVGVTRQWVIGLEAGKRALDLSLVLQTFNALGLQLEVRDRPLHRDATRVDIDKIVARSQKR